MPGCWTRLLVRLGMALVLPDFAHPNVAKKRKDDCTGSTHDIFQSRMMEYLLS